MEHTVQTPGTAHLGQTRLGILAVSSLGMASLALTPSYAAIAQDFSLSNTSAQMLTSLPNIFMMLAGLLVGRLTLTKLNLKTLTLGSICLIVCGGFLPLAFHTSFVFLLLCSCLVGLGQGACTNLAQVLIAQMLPKKQRQETIGLTTTAINIGGIIFIMGGGRLAAGNHWVNNYWIYLFSALVLVVVGLLLPWHSQISDEQTEQSSTAVHLNKYVFYCSFWAFCVMLLNNVLNNNIAMYVVQNHLGATVQAALTSTISLVGGMLCGLVVGVIGKKMQHTTIALSLVLYGCSYLLIGFAHSLSLIYVGSFVVGAAMSIAMGQFPYLISISVDANSMSLAIGIYAAINAIGGAVSPLVVNSLTPLFGNLNVFSVSGILALVFGLVCLGGHFQKNLVENALE